MQQVGALPAHEVNVGDHVAVVAQEASSHTGIGRKIVAFALSVLLVCSMADVTAFAEAVHRDAGSGSTEQGVSVDPADVGIAKDATSDTRTSSHGIAQEGPEQVSIAIETGDHAHLVIGDAIERGMRATVPGGKPLAFSVVVDEGHELVSITAKTAQSAQIALATEGNASIVPAEFVNGDLTIAVETREASGKDPSATADPSSGESLESAADSSANAHGADEEEHSLSAATLSSDQVSLVFDMNAAGFSEENDRYLMPKMSGDTPFGVTLGIVSSDLDGAIVAIPKAKTGYVDLESSVADVVSGTLPASALAGVTGLDAAGCDEFFVIVVDTRGSGGSTLKKVTALFSFIAGITPPDAIQPIQGYVFAGEEVQIGGTGLLGTDIAIAPGAEAVKDDTVNDYALKAQTETISFSAALASISDGDIAASGTGAALDDRPYTDPAGDTYTIAYLLKLDTDRDDLTTGRFHLDAPATIHNKLTGFHPEGKPTSITVTGNGYSKTITAQEIEQGAADGGTSYAFSFPAALGADGRTVVDRTYTVAVTYSKDAYTNLYGVEPEKLDERVLIDNTAWVEYETQAYTNPIAVPENPQAITNAIGYRQLAPGDIALRIQKKIQTKTVSSANYEQVNQSKYPEVVGDESVKVEFQLVGTSGEALGQTIKGKINDNGLAQLVGLKPSSEYDLSETQGIEGFSGLSDALKVKTGELQQGGTMEILVGDDGVNYYANTLPVLNVAKYQGVIDVTVREQDAAPSSSSYGQSKPVAGRTVYLFEVGPDGEKLVTSAVSGSGTQAGKVTFENIDATKTYIVRGQAPGATYTTADAAVAFDQNSDAQADIHYTSIYGSFTIGAKIVDPSGAVLTGTNSFAQYTLTNKMTGQRYGFSVFANTNAASKVAQLALPSGTYTLTETAICTNGQWTTQQYDLVPSQDITITAGSFTDIDVGVLENRSNHGQAKIKVFDYGNYALNHGTFYFRFTETTTNQAVTTSLSTAQGNGWAEGYSQKTFNLPAGTYRVEQYSLSGR